ncbi:hypothetical protein OG594_02640 [Streptomyces sp. NBC_01214]|uniref:hypothetical protein n=1 Tax=Streptomyces sp. NBC_01214 TaxID=2903777 RepID=UPI0022544A67|nr:hypothetical protein [Streptomyces sp. NBC_01214]MCX4800579.1 hypothetical protein [Streptomyces sp. NBC_01214]
MSARVLDFSPPLKVYRQHRCMRHHRNYLSFARCAWRNAEWVDAFEEADELPYALVVNCRKRYRRGDQRTVSLWATRDRAELQKAWIDRYGCGGGCYLAHELILLEPDHEKSPCRATEAFSNTNHMSTAMERN